MEYQYIVNPATNRRCRVDTVLGRRIVKNYMVQSGGMFGMKPAGVRKAINAHKKGLKAFQELVSAQGVTTRVESLQYMGAAKVSLVKSNKDLKKGALWVTVKQARNVLVALVGNDNAAEWGYNQVEGDREAQLFVNDDGKPILRIYIPATDLIAADKSGAYEDTQLNGKEYMSIATQYW